MSNIRPSAEHKDLISDHLKGVDDKEELREIAAALSYCFSGIPELEELAKKLIQIMQEAHWKGDKPDYLMPFTRLVFQADRWLMSRDAFLTINTIEKLKEELMKGVVNPIKKIFQRKDCRIRLYAIDLFHGRYIGLAALGMDRHFVNQFEKGLEIDVFEPPYEVVENTFCYILTRDRILKDMPKDIAQTQQHVYLNQLGMNQVSVTYTWHFSASGPETYEDLKKAIASHTPQCWWALSFDLGANGEGETLLSVPFLRIAESLLAIITPALAETMTRIINMDNVSVKVTSCPGADTQTETLSCKATTSNQANTVLESHLKQPTISPIRNKTSSGKAESLPKENDNIENTIDSASDMKDTDLSPWLSESDCIPGEEPWFFAKSDDDTTNVANTWEELRTPCFPPGSLLLYAQTGCGKEIVARSLAGELSRGGLFQHINTTGDEKHLKIELFGVVEDYFTGVKAAESKLKVAGSGVAFIDEFPGWLLNHLAIEPSLRSDIENLAQGRKVYTLGSEGRGGIPWRNNALLVFAGPPDETNKFLNKYEHWQYRFRKILPLPCWADLSLASRACIVRWLLLRYMDKLNIKKAFLHREVYARIIIRPDKRFNEKNMRAVESVINNANIMKTTNNESVMLLYPNILESRFNISKNKQPIPRYISVDSLNEPEWMSLGEKSIFDRQEWLGPMCDLVRAIAGCSVAEHTGKKKGCISGKLKTAVLYDEDSMTVGISGNDLLDLHYLLLAAVRDTARVKSENPENSEADPFLTASSRVTHHFTTSGPYNDAFRANFSTDTSVTAFMFRITSKDGGKTSQFPFGPRFRQHVQDNARRLQSLVERVACAYPPYFHKVPYWSWDQLHSSEKRIGEKHDD